MVYKQPKSKYWWYKFTWEGEPVRKSSRQTNRRIALQIEAAHKTQLAKGEVGIEDRKPVPTLREFAERDFMPYIAATKVKLKTLAYYQNGTKNIVRFDPLAGKRMDKLTTEPIGAYIANRQQGGLAVSSINRELQVLRRMFALAQEWGRVEKALPKVRMIAGEKHRERILTTDEEIRYFAAASSEEMKAHHADPMLLHDVTRILMECGMRPEECFRLTWANLVGGQIEIHYGKTDNARRRIPFSARVALILKMRKNLSTEEWVFPARTKSGHIEPSSLKKRHIRACKIASIKKFELYTLRHTCLTRWAPHMDPWTLHKLAGHRDMAVTKRYVHPQEHTIRDAIERAHTAQAGHTFGHTDPEGADQERVDIAPSH